MCKWNPTSVHFQKKKTPALGKTVKCGICTTAQEKVIICSEQSRASPYSRPGCLNWDTKQSTTFIWNNKEAEGSIPNGTCPGHTRCLACRVLAWSIWLPTNHCCHLGSGTNTTDIRYFPLASALEVPLFIMPVWVESLYRLASRDTIWMRLWLSL